MTVLRASNAPIGLNKGKPVRAVGGASDFWLRPTDWVSFTDPSSSDEKVIGTVAVWNQASNYIAFTITTTDASQYNVDWGDGTSENVNSGVKAEKNYVFTDLSSGTLTSRGYRQAVITITPTNAGRTFSLVQLNQRHSGITAGTTLGSNPWLDIAVAAPNATEIVFAYSNAGTRTFSMQLCEQINIVAHNMTNMANLFNELRELQSVKLSSTAAVTNMGNMFNGCSSLQTVPLFDTALVTTINSMFQSCVSLKTVPLFNMASVTDSQSMFRSCSSLQTVPLFNTSAVTTMSNMFRDCSSLQNVPLFDTTALTGDIQFMFDNCRSLETVPLFDTSATTNMTNMFQGCISLKTVPLFDTGLVQNTTNMFSGCVSLQTVPLFNMASVTTVTNMFFNCSSMRDVPLFNVSAVVTGDTMFSGCTSLQTVPAFNFAAATSVRNMFLSCVSLQNVPELTIPKVGAGTVNNLSLGGTSVATACTNIGQAKLIGNRSTQSFQNCKMGAAQLDEMYTNLATLNPSVTNVTATGTVVTYTVSDIRAFIAFRTATMTGITPSAYNLTSVTIQSVTAGGGNTGTFTVNNAATGAFVSGGIASLTDNRTITVTNNPGTAGDDPTIAQNKGWSVTG